MLEPKVVTIKTQSGVEREYTISKFDCISGRKIIASYPLSSLPKIGDYGQNEAAMVELMAFVAVTLPGGAVVRLSTLELVRNHVPDWETLARLEMATLEYNVSFFGRAEISAFLNDISQKAQVWIMKTLTDLSAQSSKAGEPPTPS